MSNVIFHPMKDSSRLDLGVRPKCSIDGCDNDCQFMGSYKKNGEPQFRKICSSCHSKITAEKRGLKNMGQVIAVNAGFSSISEYQNALAVEKGFTDYYDYQNALAIEKGFKSYSDYQNSKHPYRKYRKDYCENIDGRLGYVCTTTIHWDGMLDVDHIDGNPSNNNPLNLQTLCKCCHALKSNMSEDYKTEGRKSLGIKY